MRRYNWFILIWYLIFLNISLKFCNAASAHIYTHQHKEGYGNERTDDGAFSPRSSNHFVNGEHHQEFDHEAILGESASS